MESEKLVLGAVDYAIFGATLAVSASFGIYFQFKKQTSNDYFLAGKNMSVIPVAFSLMATFLSATNLMGIPADMYLYGTNMAFMNIGFIIGPIISAYVFLPIYINNNVSTAYEYLEKRFGKFIRRIVSAMFGILTTLFTAVSLYAPALALSAVTNLSMWTSIITVGVVCTVYCTLGGMRAVLFADVFQAILMFVVLFAICIKGCLEMDGVSNVFRIASDGGRLIIPKFSFDLTAHYTFFNVLFQGLIITTSGYGAGQMQVQRLLTLRNLKQSQVAAILSIPMVVVFQLLCCFSGLIFYAYFQSCDPLSSANKPINSADQLMPYFITTTMSEYYGLPGLCVSGIFSASLSSVSSALNSLASITTEDFIRPLFPKTSISMVHTKLISLFYGVVCLAMSTLMSSMGNLIRVIILIFGLISGPNLAIFILAACTKATNEEGVIFGVLAGLAVGGCLSFIPEKRIDPSLPLSNSCPDIKNLYSNTSILQEPTQNIGIKEALTTPESYENEEHFHLAYMWISTIGLVTTLVVGYSISVIFGCFKEKGEKVPDAYLSPIRVSFAQKLKGEKKSDTHIVTISEKFSSKPTPEYMLENITSEKGAASM